eukprot:230638-Rhodomonas_salina.1
MLRLATLEAAGPDCSQGKMFSLSYSDIDPTSFPRYACTRTLYYNAKKLLLPFKKTKNYQFPSDALNSIQFPSSRTPGSHGSSTSILVQKVPAALEWTMLRFS